MRYHFAGWSPGTTIEQNHCLALASTILHRPLSSNMAAVGGQFTGFYGLFLFVQLRNGIQASQGIRHHRYRNGI